MLHNLIVLFLCISSITASGTQAWKSRVLNHERAPFAAVEAKITPASAVRDNYRIATNRTTDQLAYVISATEQFAVNAAHGVRFTVIAQNLTPYQLRLFSLYGYTLAPLANNEDNIKQYNVTWRLPE